MIQETTQQVNKTVVYLALFIIIILGIRMMAYMVNIILISVLLTLMLIPSMTWLKKHGFSDFSAATFITVTTIIVLLAFILVAFYSIALLMYDLPLYQAELNTRLAEISSIVSSQPLLTGGMFTIPSFNLMSIAQIVTSSLMGFGEGIVYLFFIGIATFFLLLESPKIPARIAEIVEKKPETLARLPQMSQYIIDFMIVRTETNLIYGVLFGGTLWLMGVHASLTWGILAFLLGYIPYIGLILAAIPAILFAFIQFGIWGAVAVIVLVCVLNLIVENPIFSYLASRKFEVPAFIILMSVIFWGWLLGVFGMFFCTPITLIVIVLFQSSDDLRKINILLGVSHLFADSPVPSETPEEVPGT
jgi:AI-2 transport protein TqsA